MVPPLHPGKIHHAVHHRALDVLASACPLALKQGGEDAGHEVHARARVPDLRAGGHRWTVEQTRRGPWRPPSPWAMFSYALNAAYGPSVPKPLMDAMTIRGLISCTRSHPKPRRPSTPGPEVLHEDVALLDHPRENLLPPLVLQVHRDRPLVAVQHGEIEAVGVGDVTQLFPGRIAGGRLELDDVRAEKGHQLTGRRTRLNVGHVQDANAVECSAHRLLRLYLYMVWRLVPGAHSLGSTQMLITADLPIP